MNHGNLAPGPGVLVIGAGVSGLTSALELRRAGFPVTVLAERFGAGTTSVVAGALWEWPPAVCGSHQDVRSLERSKQWCRTSYAIFSELAANPATGVFLRHVNFYFRQPLAGQPGATRKMNEVRPEVRDFRHDAALIAENGIDPRAGVVDAYRYLAPMIDTDAYLQWLLGEMRRAGCRLVTRRLTGPLAEQTAGLQAEFGAELVVNCSGLGARELAGDDVWPLRGALVRVLNDGAGSPRINEAHCVSHEEGSSEPYFMFIVPRGERMLLLGGMAEENQWSLDIDLDNYAPLRAMLQRCRDFLPDLGNLRLDPAEPVRVGLRPVRRQNVRLEHEAATGLLHNYGHGGSGVTFSWGCAREVAARARALLPVGEYPAVAA